MRRDEARRSDLARTKIRSRPPISGLRRPVGEPHSPVSWSRQTPDSTNSDSRSSEPARLASSRPTRKAARGSHGPVGHQWRGHAILSPEAGDNRDKLRNHLNDHHAKCREVGTQPDQDFNGTQTIKRSKRGKAMCAVQSIKL